MSTEAHPGRTETAGPAPDPRSATSVSDADLAARLVVDAGTLARRLREGGLDVSRKTTISDVVTEADTAAERRITDLLAHHRPEEASSARRARSSRGGTTVAGWWTRWTAPTTSWPAPTTGARPSRWPAGTTTS